jgi:hypothetical protein
MDLTQRKGIMNASLHIIEAELEKENPQPANAIIVALNSMSLDDQSAIAKRIVAFLKEQEVLSNLKQSN